MATQAAPAQAGSEGSTNRESEHGLEAQGLLPRGTVRWNLINAELMECAARREEGQFAEMGPFVAVTAPHTGRSPNDKFVVEEPSSRDDVDWGNVNRSIRSEE